MRAAWVCLHSGLFDWQTNNNQRYSVFSNYVLITTLWSTFLSLLPIKADQEAQGQEAQHQVNNNQAEAMAATSTAEVGPIKVLSSFHSVFEENRSNLVWSDLTVLNVLAATRYSRNWRANARGRSAYSTLSQLESYRPFWPQAFLHFIRNAMCKQFIRLGYL